MQNNIKIPKYELIGYVKRHCSLCGKDTDCYNLKDRLTNLTGVICKNCFKINGLVFVKNNNLLLFTMQKLGIILKKFK